MKFSNSSFRYSKSQRRGVLLLLSGIVFLQGLYVFVDFSLEDLPPENHSELLIFQKEIDSLKQINKKSKKSKIYPFNPNFITDYKGYKLGMSVESIDRLHRFRKTNKYVNSAKEFQQVTKISDSLLKVIAPYFKFPKWVTNQTVKKYNKTIKKISTNDLNKATAEDLATINGIGETFSKRIIKYRTKLQGFSFDSQLYEVWGLEKEVVLKIVQTFHIVSKPDIKKIDINTATFKQVLKTPYVDYELCKKIFNYRDEVAELQNISELKKIKGFPINKYEKIILYLEAK